MEELLKELRRVQIVALIEREHLVAYRNYIEANLDRIARDGWTPVCFAEFLTSEEFDTYGSKS